MNNIKKINIINILIIGFKNVIANSNEISALKNEYSKYYDIPKKDLSAHHKTSRMIEIMKDVIEKLPENDCINLNRIMQKVYDNVWRAHEPIEKIIRIIPKSKHLSLNGNRRIKR
jgi:hypothetical protein